VAAGVLSTLKPDPKLALPQLIAAAKGEAGAGATPSTSPTPPSSPMNAASSIDQSQRDHARASAVSALAVIGANNSEAQKTLVNLATDAVPEVRMVVARALAELGPDIPQAFDSEIKLTSDPDMYIQARAVTALGSFPQKYVVSSPVLYRAYLSKQRPLQEGAELSLEKIVKSASFNAEEALRSKDAAQRFAAVFGLSSGSDEGMNSLCKALTDVDPGVRFLAARKLGNVSGQRSAAALKALKSLVDEKDEDVRNRMYQSRAHLTPKPARSTEQ
jgi:HEAT repeat protein